MARADIDIKVNPAQVAEIERLTAGIKNGVPRVLVRAINKVTRFQFTAVKRLLAKKTKLKQGDVAKGMRRVLASYKKMTAIISVRGRGIPLIRMKARGKEPSRGKGKGVTYINALTGARERMEHAFIATMPKTGHRGVFIRTEPKLFGRVMRRLRGHKTDRGRLPIKEQYGPSMVDVFQPEIDRVRVDTGERLAREIGVQAELVIKGAQVSGA